MAYENITISTENKIQTITINRPDKMNALNRDTLAEIRKAVHNTYDDAEVAGVIITGAGEKAFVAGADISEFKDISVDEGSKLAANGHTIFNIIERSPKPVIAAVNGFALGGGCELAMACHMRVASENAKFGQPEVNLGLIPGYGGTQRLVQLIGKSKAMELLMTADMIGAAEAKELGLVNYIVPAQDLQAKCVEILEKVKTKSPVAIAEIVKCVDAYYASDKDGFETEIERFGSCFGTEDVKEGTAAFLEKRKANFPGK